MFDNYGCECVIRYSSNYIPLQYQCRLLQNNSVSCWHKISLCDVVGVLKIVIESFLLISSDWEKLRVILVSSRLIVHPKNSSSGPIDQVTYSLLIHYNVSNNTCLSPIIRISYTCKMRIAIPSLFTMYKRQGSYLHFFNSSFRVIFLMYYLNTNRAVFKIQ